MNYYKRHLGDYAKSLSNLSQGQIGAYDLLLDWHYANEKPLPFNKDELYTIGRSRSKAERDNVDRVLQYFEKTDAGYVQKRALEEMDRAAARGEVNQRIAAAREAAKRATNQERNEHDSCSERVTNEQPSHKPLAIKEKEARSKEGAGAPEVDPDKAMWDAGVAAGIERVVIGKCVKEHGKAETMRAIATIVADKPADPKTYLLGVLRKSAASGDVMKAEFARAI